MSFDSVIFDVDGTLWDASNAIAFGFSEASRYFDYGIKDFSRDEILKELGKPLKVIFNDLYPEIREQISDEEEIDKVLTKIGDLSLIKEYEAIKKYGGRPYDNLRETLTEIRKHVPTFIVSNCEKGYIELFLEKTGTADLFDGHLCFGDTLREKDFTIRRLMDDHGLKDSCYVGDILNDALCSKKAGIPFIWAAYGFGSVDSDLYFRKIDEFSELKNIIIG